MSNLNILPGSGSGGGGGAGSGYTETFTFTTGDPGIVTQPGPGGAPLAVGLRVSVSIGSILSMTVNGDAQTTYDFLQSYTGQTRSGSTDYLWWFADGNNQLSWTYPPPAGATIVVQYVPASATNTSLAQYGTALAPLDPMGAPLGTCGSGLYEGVLQVQNISSQTDLNAIAAAELARIGGVPTIVDYETDYPGLRPGQLQSINIPNSGIPAAQLLITKVSGVYIPPGLANGGSFRWQVQATSNLDPGNWIKWYERLVARTGNPLPILQYEEATFVLGAGASLSSGVSTTNPYIVGRTGLMVQFLLAASAPPADETLVLAVTRGGVAIATLTMPATTAANQLITVPVPAANQLYLFAGDVLNCNVSYSVTGPNPTPASGVTLKRAGPCLTLHKNFHSPTRRVSVI